MAEDLCPLAGMRFGYKALQLGCNADAIRGGWMRSRLETCKPQALHYADAGYSQA